VSVHKVTLGPNDGKHTVVLSGLAAGDTVVTDGMDRLSDGAKIEVAAAKQATAGGASAAASSAEPASSASSAGAKHGHRRRPPGSAAQAS
jgi:multidrug efflux system membrane fusion protein